MIAATMLLATALVVTPAESAVRIGAPAGVGRLSARLLLLLCGVAAAIAAVCLLPPTVVIAAAVVAGTIAARRQRLSRRARRRSECTALRDGLEILVGELRVGAHPVVAFDVASREVDGEVAAALRGVAARGRLGGDVAAGLGEVSRASTVPEHWERLAACWQLAHSHGLAIATLMRAAHHDIVERERFSARLDAGLAGARTTATVLAGMPILGIILGQLIGADPLRFLVSGGAGGWLLVVGVTLSCLGLWWSDRIVAGLPT